MYAIGANTPRLHGFHRFLPHLWELFYFARAPLLGWAAILRAFRLRDFLQLPLGLNRHPSSFAICSSRAGQPRKIVLPSCNFLRAVAACDAGKMQAVLAE